MIVNCIDLFLIKFIICVHELKTLNPGTIRTLPSSLRGVIHISCKNLYTHVKLWLVILLKKKMSISRYQIYIKLVLASYCHYGFHNSRIQWINSWWHLIWWWSRTSLNILSCKLQLSELKLYATFFSGWLHWLIFWSPHPNNK